MTESWLKTETKASFDGWGDEENEVFDADIADYIGRDRSWLGGEIIPKRLYGISERELLYAIFNEMRKHREESDQRFDTVDSANQEIIRLQNKLNDLQNDIVKFQTETPKIYYLGAIFGSTGSIFGLFTSNVLYLCCGLGVAITAFFGIFESKVNARRGII